MTLPRAAGVALAAGALLQARRRRRRWLDLRDAVVLVTGGSAGLGLAIARECAAAGARLAICGRNADAAEGAAEELRERGTEVRAYACDVADRSSVDRMVAGIEQELGPVDVLVNNAGVIDVGEVGAGEHGTFAQMMDAMFWGTVHPTLAVLGGMRARGEARIANVTSIGGRVSVPHLVPNSCAKHAAYAFSQGMRAELADDGILVTTVVPGLMHTGSHRAVQVRDANPDEYAWFALAGANRLLATSPERAARRIVEGVRRGDPHVVIGVDAKVATLVEGLAPGLVAGALSAVNRLLPDSGKEQARRQPGWSLETPLTRSGLTEAGRAAAEDLQAHRGGPAEPATPRLQQEAEG